MYEGGGWFNTVTLGRPAAAIEFSRQTQGRLKVPARGPHGGPKANVRPDGR